ncbi:MAG: SpoIID/LytB domain-containing protein [Oscillospiraceae bacterium]|nr:SpoIID/LytB domain-containing protein [Oscillospiraceae bacterium]
MKTSKNTRVRAARALRIALAAAFVLVAGFSHSPVRAAPKANPLMSIGLYYGDTALNAANLLNAVGSGYRFGYMTGDEFTEVARTSATAITVFKNRNVCVTPSGNYVDGTSGGILVGAWHDNTGKSFSDAAEAAAAAAGLRAEGKMAFVSYDRVKNLWYIRMNSYGSSSGGKISGTQYCVTVALTGTNDIIFQYDSASADNSLVIAPDITGQVRPSAVFKGETYCGYFRYARMEGNDITVCNLVSMQDYCKGVIPYEMSASWHVEALKAQTLAAKSYLSANTGRHKASGFDLCNNSHCQVYRGTRRATENSDRAVDETYGMYVTYDGAVCHTYYSSSNGGASEDVENVWTAYMPYLRGVRDDYENLSSATNGIWQLTLTNASLSQLLTSKGYPNSGVVNFYVSKFTNMGNAYEITFTDSSGKKTVITRCDRVRSFLSLNSVRFRITSGLVSLDARSADSASRLTGGFGVWVIGEGGSIYEAVLGDAFRVINGDGLVMGLPATPSEDGVYTVEGRGWGHSVGMSQWGARGMAELGFTFDEIIRFYYKGANVTAGEA